MLFRITSRVIKTCSTVLPILRPQERHCKFYFPTVNSMHIPSLSRLVPNKATNKLTVVEKQGFYHAAGAYGEGHRRIGTAEKNP